MIHPQIAQITQISGLLLSRAAQQMGRKSA